MNIIGFALCLENSDCDDLELNKVYPVVESEENDPHNYLRVIDESEEDLILASPGNSSIRVAFTLR